MKKTFEVDTWSELQKIIAVETRNFAPGFSYTVRQDNTRASLPWVLTIEDGQHEPAKG